MLKKRFVTALLVGAIGVSLCATGAMAAKTKDFVPIEDVVTEGRIRGY